MKGSYLPITRKRKTIFFSQLLKTTKKCIFKKKKVIIS